MYALLNNFADPMSLHYTLAGQLVIMVVLAACAPSGARCSGGGVVAIQDYISR